MEPNFEFFPRLRAMSNLINLDVPIYIGGITNFDKSVQDDLNSFPTLLNYNWLFYMKNKYPDFAYNTYNDLKKYTIGIGVGSSPEKVAKENGLKYEALLLESLLK